MLTQLSNHLWQSTVFVAAAALLAWLLRENRAPVRYDEHTPRLPGTARGGAAPPEPGGPTIFAALDQQWGLKLEPDKGPRGYIVVDRVEPPTIDTPAPTAEPSARASGPGGGTMRGSR